MPCYAYALTFPREAESARHEIEARAKAIYDDLKISQTGVFWKSLLTDRVIDETKAIRPLRQRLSGGRLILGLRRGDVLIIPECSRAFCTIKDVSITASSLAKNGIRVIVADVGLDTNTSAGMLAAKVMSDIYAKKRKGGVVKRKKTLSALAGRPILGIRIKGPRRSRFLCVDPELYDLGLKVLQWNQDGRNMKEIADHLYKHRIFRSQANVGRLGAISRMIWTDQALQKLADNMAKIDQLVLDGKVRLPVTWRPAIGPLSLLPGQAPSPRQVGPERWALAKHIGRRVKELRLEKRWTQKQLADECGVAISQSQVSEIEMARHLPTTDTLIHLARAFGVDLTELAPAPQPEPDLQPADPVPS